MGSNSLSRRNALSRWVTIWFALDWLVALLPPIHWGLALPLPDLLGVPATLVYFISVAVFIGASVVFAYWVDTRNGYVL